MDKNNIPEEVTVTPVIRDIERLINKLVSSIWYLIRGMASGLVLLLQFNIKHLKLILPIAIVAMIIGFASVNFIPRTYRPNLLLRLNVESEGQLYSDVGYFNSLVQEEKLDELAKLFQISEEDASSLKNFEIKPHSSYREKLDIINNIYRELDSATYQHIDFDLLLEGGFSAVSSRFMIEVVSTDQKIFSKLESSLLTYLERVPELQKMKQDEVSRLFYEKQILMEEMNRLDTLKKVYNQALLEKAKSDKGASAGTTVMLGQQKEGSSLNPLDIYNKYLYYSKEVSRIDQMMSALDNVYDVHAHFSDFGAKSGAGRSLRALYAAIMGLIFSYAIVGLFSISKKATHKMPEAVASRTKKLLFNIAGTGAIKALNIGIGFLLVRFSIQFLGEENYGVWLAMLSFFTWFSAFEVGVSSSVRNFITKAFAESNFEQIKALIEKALKALSMIYVISIAAILVASFMFPIQHFFVGDGSEIPNFSFIFRFSTVFYLSHFVFFLLNTVYFAIHRTTASFLILAIQNALLLLGVVAMIQLVDTNQFLYYAIWFSVVPAATWFIASIVSYLTSLKQAKPSFTKTVFKKSEPFKMVNWAFFLIQICMLVIYSTDNLIIINLLGGTDVALYNIAFKYFNIIQVGFNLIIVPYWSSFTDAAHQKDVPWIKKNVSILLQIWLAFAVLAILMYLVAPTAYRLWMGKEMEIPTLFSMIMALSALLTAWIAIFSYFLNAVAELKAQRNIILVSAFINIPLSIWLLGLFGISGVIMATCVSLLPLAIVLPQQYLRVVQKMNIES